MPQSLRHTRTPWAWAGLLVAAAVGGSLLRSLRGSRFDFRGKAILITGGSRGLGLEIARLLAQQGAWIAIAARNSETLATAKKELQQYGTVVLTIPCDVRQQEQMESAVEETVRNFGRIDVLINDAGVIQVGPFETMTLEDFEDAMATHAWGPLYAIRAAFPHMRNQGAGRIVNMSSIGGKIGVPHLLPYVMSKFALAGLSEGLQAEAARYGIHVTTVYPGLMRTGSHVNARFKGKNQREFAWFSIAAGFPVLSVNARRAARQIVEACRHGRKQLIITPGARLAVLASAVTPELVDRSLEWTNVLLPSAGSSQNSESHSGWESRSWLSPSPLTHLADQAIDRNNESSEAS